jgi:hypothetical protein
MGVAVRMDMICGWCDRPIERIARPELAGPKDGVVARDGKLAHFNCAGPL